ncbi:MAG: methyltransferase domain-containing protein [Phycisphaerales bacterium JB040]
MSDAGAGAPVGSAPEAAQRRDWPAYFDRMEGKPPRETLIRAASSFDTPGFAVDLGCGAGRDTQELLERGWRVWACDASEDGLRRVRANPVCARGLEAGTLEVVPASFERIAGGEVSLPSCDLLNASFALPFCPPGCFGRLWAAIDGAVRPGGRFGGQFFGERDSWAILEDRTHLTRPVTLALFDRYVLEHLQEEDRASTQPDLPHKHWHVFHVVARKRP